MKAETTVAQGQDARVIRRRRATDWTRQEREHTAATTSADCLLAKVHEHTQTLKLAAFAAEARRTLSAIEDALVHRPEMRAELRDNIVGMTEWVELEDTSAEVLRHTADELRAAAAGLAGLVHDLASRLVEPVHHQPAMAAA